MNTSKYYLSDISVIIPVHEYNATLHIALKSYEKLVQKPLEIIVVLDGISKDDKYFSFFEIPVTVIESKSQKGPANARNLGASIARGKLFYFSDSDVAIKTSTLKNILNCFNENEFVDALIGSYDDEPLHVSLISKYRNLLHHYVHQQSPPNISTFWGACGTIKKSVFDSLGGFDISFIKPSVEDIEFGYRIKSAGYTIILEKTIQVKHLKKWNLTSVVKTDLLQRAIPWTKLLLQYNRLGEKNLNVNLTEKIAIVLICMLILTFFLAPFISIKLLYISFILALLLLFLKRKLYFFFHSYFSFYTMPLIIFYHWIFLTTAMFGFLIARIQHIWNKCRLA